MSEGNDSHEQRIQIHVYLTLILKRSSLTNMRRNQTQRQIKPIQRLIYVFQKDWNKFVKIFKANN